MAESPVVHLHVLLPADLDEQLRQAADRSYRSLSGEVRAALAEHLKGQPPRTPERWEGTE
jgi:hypothetical protein